MNDLTKLLYEALKTSPCKCTEARSWFKDAEGKIVPDQQCRRCVAIAVYEASVARPRTIGRCRT